MADLSGLPNGEYAIKCQLRGQFVGRAKNEDHSTRPKPIITIPGPRDHVPWFVRSVGGNKYILSISEGRTAPLGGNVYAIIEGGPKPEEWIIERQKQSGLFTWVSCFVGPASTNLIPVVRIESSDRRGGWVLPQDAAPEGTQVDFHPLIIGPSEPPFFPPTELWEFIPANKY
ncbi:hypothetical protein BD779DRAFT_1582658 [Infundibulicybe gibba]|nr:hypothetical protein BD779DRAFT_1582658 [Infundibulicybe gibba]